VHLSGPGLEGSRMGKETYFIIDGSLSAPGKNIGFESRFIIL
jgi:hypothetical protein